jgi:hypothetical protein
MSLLKKAPINNIDAEKSINYELNRRGVKELKAAGAAHLKAKSSTLWNCSRWNDSRNLAERLKRLIPWFLFSS